MSKIIELGSSPKLPELGSSPRLPKIVKSRERRPTALAKLFISIKLHEGLISVPIILSLRPLEMIIIFPLSLSKNLLGVPKRSLYPLRGNITMVKSFKTETKPSQFIFILRHERENNSININNQNNYIQNVFLKPKHLK